MPNLKHLVPADPEIQASKIFNFFSSFAHCIFSHKMEMHPLIELKLGTGKGLIKVHLHTNYFG